MKFGSLCSGIEAASVAWEPLGWRADWFSEIESFPCAVLSHHWPDTPNLGDMTTIKERILAGEVPAPDVFTGGTPCQAFSVAGNRKSLADERGNLSLEFTKIADAIDEVRAKRKEPPTIVVWENVPGVLSTSDNAFGCFIAELAGCDTPIVPVGNGWTNAGMVIGPKRTVAWRILDAQYFGVAQRRRRVFVVASAGNRIDPAAVLFEPQSLRWHPAPRRRSTADIAGTLTARFGRNGGAANDDVVANRLVVEPAPNNNRATHENQHAEAVLPVVVGTIAAHSFTGGMGGRPDGAASGHVQVMKNMAVRRLTPRECERLQGFQDDHTLVMFNGKPATDTPRYKAIGNSWAVPVARWIGERIQQQLEQSA